MALGFRQAIASNVGFALAASTIARTVLVQQKPSIPAVRAIIAIAKLYPPRKGLFFARYQMSTLAHVQAQTAHHRPKATILF